MRALEVAAPWGADALKVVERPDPTPGGPVATVTSRIAVRNELAADMPWRSLMALHSNPELLDLP